MPTFTVGLAIFMGGAWLRAATKWNFGHGQTTFVLLALAAGPGMVVFATVGTIRRLLRTGLRHVEFELDADTLTLRTSGYGKPKTLAWPRTQIIDVIPHEYFGGAYELRIIFPESAAPNSLLFGAGRQQVHRIAHTLGRALGLDPRLNSVAAWWEVSVPEPRRGDALHDDAAAAPILNYAPDPKETLSGERTAAGARVLVPPVPPRVLIRQLWPVGAGIVILGVLAAALLPRSAGGGINLSWMPVILVNVFVILSRCLDAFRRWTIEVNGVQVTVTTRGPFARDQVRSWSAGSVREIVADGQTVKLRLRAGESATLLTCDTPEKARSIVSRLHPPPLPGVL